VVNARERQLKKCWRSLRSVCTVLKHK